MMRGRGMMGPGMSSRGGYTQMDKNPKVPYDNYVCDRCGVPGHFKQYCPTNNDRNFDPSRNKGCPLQD
jgi:E3 ubiquitin-protein ligase RBBP6